MAHASWVVVRSTWHSTPRGAHFCRFFGEVGKLFGVAVGAAIRYRCESISVVSFEDLDRTDAAAGVAAANASVQLLVTAAEVVDLLTGDVEEVPGWVVSWSVPEGPRGIAPIGVIGGLAFGAAACTSYGPRSA